MVVIIRREVIILQGYMVVIVGRYVSLLYGDMGSPHMMDMVVIIEWYTVVITWDIVVVIKGYCICDYHTGK